MGTSDGGLVATGSAEAISACTLVGSSAGTVLGGGGGNLENLWNKKQTIKKKEGDYIAPLHPPGHCSCYKRGCCMRGSRSIQGRTVGIGLLWGSKTNEISMKNIAVKVLFMNRIIEILRLWAFIWGGGGWRVMGKSMKSQTIVDQEIRLLNDHIFPSPLPVWWASHWHWFGATQVPVAQAGLHT